eukprot:5871918-Prymnesium_polylepis.1
MVVLLLAAGTKPKVRNNISKLRAIDVAHQASLLGSIDMSASSKLFAPKQQAWQEITALLLAADRESRNSDRDDESRVRWCWWAGPCGCVRRTDVIEIGMQAPPPARQPDPRV